MEQFWGASKAFWLYRWTTVYDIFGGNSFLIYTAGTYACTFNSTLRFVYKCMYNYSIFTLTNYMYFFGYRNTDIWCNYVCFG